MEPGHLLHSALTRPTSAVARRVANLSSPKKPDLVSKKAR